MSDWFGGYTEEELYRERFYTPTYRGPPHIPAPDDLQTGSTFCGIFVGEMMFPLLRKPEPHPYVASHCWRTCKNCERAQAAHEKRSKAT